MVEPSGITIDARTSQPYYPFGDIREIRLMTFREKRGFDKVWAQVCGVDLDETYVSLQLTKNPRMPFWSWKWRNEYRTDAAGIPTASNQLILAPNEPDAFIETVTPMLTGVTR